jgi:hypothetical protein
VTGFGELVELLPGPTLDENDDPVPGVGEPVEVYGVVEPVGSEEPVERGRSGVVERMRVYISAPPPYPISRYARIRIRGLEYRVEGTPADWQDPDGSDLGGVIVEAVRAKG